MVGLGRMGANLAQRSMAAGHSVVGFDPRPDAVTALERTGAAGAQSLTDLVGQLPAPRTVWVMVPAGDITESVTTELIDLLDEQIWHWTDGTVVQLAAEDRHRELIESERSALIEGVVTESEDEELMDRFIGGEHVDVGLLTKDLERAVARGHFHPVVGHAETGSGVGAELILDLIVRGFPSPDEHALPTVTAIVARV